MKSRCGCGCGSDCSDQKPESAKKIEVHFMYLSLSECDRCCGTGMALEEAIAEAKPALTATGVEVALTKTLVETREMAIKLRFASSPTIRVNGCDICSEVTETGCKDCGDLCGSDVDCRSWVYQGKQYDVPPKALFIDAILRQLYSPAATRSAHDGDFVLPSNLEKFFAGKEAR